jgi:nickel/cobalt transporter (NicO) family protein
VSRPPARRPGGRLVRQAVAVLAAAGALALLPAVSATAHPLGNLSVNRYDGLVVAPGELLVDHVQDLAEIPTAQARPAIDADHDGRQSPAELAGWANRTCARSAGELAVSLDGRRVPVATRSAAARFQPGQAGLPTLRLECAMIAELRGPRNGSTVALLDRAPTRPGWREITARGDRMTLLASDVLAESSSRRLTWYPKDMLTAPADQRHATLRVRPGGPPLRGSAGQATGIGRVLPRGADRFAEALTGLVARRALTLGFGALAAVVALALGALHALAPGHGKTVMAAYAASRGRRSRREVLALGATVTVTHTAGVLTLGLLVATGSTLAPAAAIPWLAVASGALVAVTGLGLLRRSLRALRQDAGHPHREERRPASRGSVVLMGFAGGMVPSPSAVVVLVGAAALGHAWFGVALVLAYGAGLAVTLSLVGVLLAGSGQWLARRVHQAETGRWLAGVPVRALPVGAAALVMVLGVGLALRGLPAALG